MYLPRRSTPVIFLPTSRFANCLRLWCRRIERMPSASTALTRLPTISRSRSRRTTSTSGSSGIIFLRSGRFGPCRDRVRAVARVRDLAEATPGDACRRLLGLLLRSALARPPRLAARPSPWRRSASSGRALRGAPGSGAAGRSLRRQLLQPGLVVVAAGTGRALDDARLEELKHERAGGVPARRRGRRRRSPPPWRRRGSRACPRPPDASSPLPSSSDGAEPDSRATSASTSLLTTEARSLASSPSGRSGYSATCSR